MEEVRERLKFYFNHMGYTNKDVAKMIGTTPQNVGYLLKSGDYKTSMLKKIFQGTKVNLSWLIYGEGEMEKGLDLSPIVNLEQNKEFLMIIAEQARKIISLEKELERYKAK